MGVSYMSVVICAAAEKIKGRNEVRSKNLDDCAALENWLITKSDDNGLDYLSNITAYIAELEAKLKDAEILLMDAQFCLQQKRAGQDENALACHIYKFLTENDDEYKTSC